jgi:hypothetical protein
LIAIGVILVFAGVFIIVSINGRKERSRSGGLNDVTRLPVNRNLSTLTSNGNEDRLTTQRSGATPEQVEKAAVQVIRRISGDDNPYVFPAVAVTEITTRVGQYRALPALAAALRSLNQRGGEIASAARQEGLEPSLVIYTALAETGGGQRGDPGPAARQLVATLGLLRPHFGCELGDCTLIMLAAYRISPGTRRSHPLLATMRRLVRNPLTERNVWHLHDRGGIDDETYRFVLDVIAYGIIAQQPEQFGVSANAVSF